MILTETRCDTIADAEIHYDTIGNDEADVRDYLVEKKWIIDSCAENTPIGSVRHLNNDKVKSKD